MTYPGRLGYTRLYPGTLRSGWDLWWLLLEGICNPKGKPWISCLLLNSPNSVVKEREAVPLLAAPNVWTGGWLRGLLLTRELYGRLTHSLHTKVQVWMGYSRLCCKRDGKFLSLTWSRFFVPAWQLDMFQPYGARLR